MLIRRALVSDLLSSARMVGIRHGSVSIAAAGQRAFPQSPRMSPTNALLASSCPN